jgi:Protein of unknown function (DUF1275)
MGFVDDSSESSAPVTMAALLAVVAGFLGALNFTGLTGTFVANQTGNTVLSGIAVADGKASLVWPALVAIMSFTVGGTLTVLVMPDQAGRGRWPLLTVEAALLVAFALIAWPAAGDQDGRASGWGARCPGRLRSRGNGRSNIGGPARLEPAGVDDIHLGDEGGHSWASDCPSVQQLSR